MVSATYHEELSSVKKICSTCNLLFRWKGSIYKLLWREVLAYFVIYVALGIIYKFALQSEEKKIFENIAQCCSRYADTIPVVLFLGFFTGNVMTRWWAVYNAIPGTGKIITLATLYMKKSNPNASKWLRTLVRYLLTSWMMCMRTSCPPLKARYPTLESIEKAGFLLRHEIQMLKSQGGNQDPRLLSLHVINWAILLVREGRDKGFLENASDASRLLDPLFAFKKSCSVVLKYQITAIPLSFVQAVTVTVQVFGIVSLMGKQFVDFGSKLLVIDCYLPILPAMQYLAYLSWLKLGEVAVNPFGEDDDDFDIISLFDNHVQLAGELLKVFELDIYNPTKDSLELTGSTLFKASCQTPNHSSSPSRNPETSILIPSKNNNTLHINKPPAYGSIGRSIHCSKSIYHSQMYFPYDPDSHVLNMGPMNYASSSRTGPPPPPPVQPPSFYSVGPRAPGQVGSWGGNHQGGGGGEYYQQNMPLQADPAPASDANRQQYHQNQNLPQRRPAPVGLSQEEQQHSTPPTGPLGTRY